MKNGLPPTFAPLLDAWRAPQTGLSKIVRWKKYIDKDEGVRVQNSLEHSHAITILGSMIAAMLQSHLDPVRLDLALIMTALAIHDVGEGEIGKDTHYIDKRTEGDLEEYLAFRKRYEPLGHTMFGPLHEAFLLQFALKEHGCFPIDARHIMQELAEDKRLEALTFDGIERWDYVLYALEQYHERGNEKILVQIFRNQIDHLDRLASELPGFGKTVWTADRAAWAMDFLAAHDGKWIEQKGEK